MRPRRFFWFCGAGGLLVLGWGAMWAVPEWQFQAGLKKAREEIASKRFEAAGRWLAAQSAGRRNHAETALLLGICEDAAGRHEAAVSAWARVPLDSPRGLNAAIARARTLASDLGRFADAEDVLAAVVAHGGPRAFQHRYLLNQLFYWEGRLDEMRRLVQERWSSSPNHVGELRSLWQMDSAVVQIDLIGAEVERAAQKAPEDDRVWLARANLAMLRGRFPEAARWLDACLQAAP